MEVSVENTGGLARRMTVQVPAERVDQEVSSRLQSMARTVRLDGFRPGKVPLKVVQQKYGRQVREEVVDQVVNTTLQEALIQENIKPAGEPRVEPGSSRSGEALVYVASFEVFPELGGSIEYGFQVTRPAVEVTDADITGMLDKLRRQRATWNAVDRAAKTDDQVVIDFEGLIDGKAFPGNKGDKMPVVLGSATMIPGFEDQLVGTSAGEEKTLKVTFPDNYPALEVAGKTAEFKVKLHSVSEMALPELNDEFAHAFGVGEGGLDGLKGEVTNNMRRELKQLVAANLKDQVFSGLLEKNPVEVPQSLVDDEVVRLQAQGNTSSPTESASQELRATAERRVQLGILISEVMKQNQIQPDPDRVREAVETIAASYEKPEEVVQWYYGNQEMLSGIQSAVIEEQVVDWIMDQENVEVKEKKTSFEELVETAKQAKG